MISNRKLLIAGALIVGLGVFKYWDSLAAFGKNLAVRFKTISIDWSKTQSALFTTIYTNLTLFLDNPTDLEATITAINVDVSYQGKKIGNVYKTGTLTIGGKTTNEIKVSLGLNTLGLFSTIPAAITALTSNKPVKVDLSGYVSSSAGNYQFNQTAALNV
jgi:LEA14-like dessication related protein